MQDQDLIKLVENRNKVVKAYDKMISEQIGKEFGHNLSFDGRFNSSDENLVKVSNEAFKSVLGYNINADLTTIERYFDLIGRL